MRRDPDVDSRIYRPAASRELLPGPGSFAACVWCCSAPGNLLAVQSPVVLWWSQTAFQTLGKGGEVFHPFEEPLPTPLPDTYNLFHGLLFCWVQHSGNPSLWVALCVDGAAEHSAVPNPKDSAFHLFPVYESLFLQACNRIMRAAPQKFRPQSDVAVVGVGWVDKLEKIYRILGRINKKVSTEYAETVG